jgi:hypothetical protein
MSFAAQMRIFRPADLAFFACDFLGEHVLLSWHRSLRYESVLSYVTVVQLSGLGLYPKPGLALLPPLPIALPSERAHTTMYSFSLLRASRQATCALRTAPVAAAPQFARSSFARAFSSSTLRREAPKPTDGEQALKAKLEEKLQGAKVDVQDVSGASPLSSLSATPDFLKR